MKITIFLLLPVVRRQNFNKLCNYFTFCGWTMNFLFLKNSFWDIQILILLFVSQWWIWYAFFVSITDILIDWGNTTAIRYHGALLLVLGCDWLFSLFSFSMAWYFFLKHWLSLPWRVCLHPPAVWLAPPSPGSPSCSGQWPPPCLISKPHLLMHVRRGNAKTTNRLNKGPARTGTALPFPLLFRFKDSMNSKNQKTLISRRVHAI